MIERVAVIRTSGMRALWDERGEADGRPWAINLRGALHDWWCRYKPESVIELTDEPKMVIDYTNIREVLDFMGVPQDRFEHVDPPPRVNLLRPKVELGHGTTVWKRGDCCYILGPNSSVFQFWTTPEGIKDQLSKMITEVEAP